MVKSTAHRGPDGSRFIQALCDEFQLFFGFNYLNITSGSSHCIQPYQKAPADAILLFNGEIYNADELKNALLDDGAAAFTSTSDTEVLYHHLLKYGQAGLGMLKGMYALIWFDPTQNTLFAARDESGQKPLYYADTTNYIILSSEIRAIEASGLLSLKINHAQINSLVRYKYIAHPDTFYQQISCLMPNHYLALNKPKEQLTQKHLVKPKKTSSFRKPEWNQILTDAILRHIPEHKPWGLFYSGGIDSALLLALLHQQHIHTQAFHISCGQSTTEVERSAKQFGAHLEIITLTTEQFMQDFDGFIDAMDQPVLDSASFLTWHLSKRAQFKTRVIWTGAGADELFAGYRRHTAFAKYLKNPLYLHIANGLKQMGLHKFLKGGIRKFVEDVQSNPQITFQNFSALYWPEFPPPVEVEPTSEPPSFDRLMSEALNRDRRQYLVNDILLLNDQMGMQHGLEMRAPFMDDDLRQAVCQLSPTELMQNGNKGILKEVLKSLGGKHIINQPKTGFGIPIGEWLRRECCYSLTESLQDNNSPIFQYFDGNFVNLLLHQHFIRKKDHGPLLWALITINAYLKKHSK